MTRRVNEDFIKNMQVVATGYKIFNNDWTCKNYKYGDDDNVVGSIHYCDGDIELCENGLHFCENPLACIEYYAPVQWNKFAKINAYGEVKKEENKSAAEIIKITDIYTFNEFIDLCRGNGDDIYGGNYIRGGNNIRGGNYIRGGNDIYGGDDIRGGNDIRGGDYIRGGCYIRGGNYIYGGNDICGGNGIYGGDDIRGGNNIYGGNGIYGGDDIRGGNNIRGGNYIRGDNGIYGGNNLFGCRNCEGISRCIFCYNETGKLKVFNKKVIEKRFDKIMQDLLAFGWYPVFNNAYELKGKNEWEETYIPGIENISAKEAWSKMPSEMRDYIKSLPEYDEEIFRKITED